MGARGADRWSSGREIYRRYAEHQKELEKWGREVYGPIWKKMCQDVLLKGYSEPLVTQAGLITKGAAMEYVCKKCQHGDSCTLILKGSACLPTACPFVQKKGVVFVKLNGSAPQKAKRPASAQLAAGRNEDTSPGAA